MNTTKWTPNTLMEAVRYFQDYDVCHNYMAKLKWPDGVVTCPKCGGAAIGFIKSRFLYQCKDQACRKQFSVKVGTIFEDSPLGLDKWFVAVWSITNAKNGISSCELARALGVTQKSAWFMLHRVRLAMKAKTFPKMGQHGSVVEADETFVGGLAKNMHAKKRAEKITGGGQVGKAVVVGLLERHTAGKKHSTVRTIATQTHPNQLEMHDIIHKNVETGTLLCTDAHASYKGLDGAFIHRFIDHADKYVDGIVHTNGLENFWSLFKRVYYGTYIHMEAQHLHRYMDEQGFRFNERKLNDGARFLTIMPGVVGRRIMYKELIGRVQ
jgi:transposase-like protein